MLLELTRASAAPEDPGLAPYVTVLASLVPHWRFPGWSAPAEPVVVMAEAVLRVLQWATGGAGVTVIWEDLHWADDATFTRLRLGRTSAACRTLLRSAGQPTPRRRAADPGLPARLVAAGVTAREAEVLDLLADRLPTERSPGG